MIGFFPKQERESIKKLTSSVYTLIVTTSENSRSVRVASHKFMISVNAWIVPASAHSRTVRVRNQVCKVSCFREISLLKQY